MQRLVKGYVDHYNNIRLNSVIGYITSKDMLAVHQREIQADRDRRAHASNAPTAALAGTTAVCHNSRCSAWKLSQ